MLVWWTTEPEWGKTPAFSNKRLCKHKPIPCIAALFWLLFFPGKRSRHQWPACCNSTSERVIRPAPPWVLDYQKMNWKLIYQILKPTIDPRLLPFNNMVSNDTINRSVHIYIQAIQQVCNDLISAGFPNCCNFISLPNYILEYIKYKKTHQRRLLGNGYFRTPLSSLEKLQNLHSFIRERVSQAPL